MRNYIDKARYAVGGSPARATFFFVFWLILYGVNSSGLVVGVAAAIMAAWASTRLLPPGSARLRPIALARLVLRFPLQSIIAGVDVARRALDPRLPLRPGFVAYQPRLPSGPTRNAFCTFVGLLPGTLPAGCDEKGRIVIHCLDLGQPVIEQLAAEETALQKVLGGACDG
jgi:multicomponent Na+:H+ antiporter subunit E